MRVSPRPAPARLVLLGVLLLALAAPRATADEGRIPEEARLEAIKRTSRDLRRQVRSRHAERHLDEIRALLDSLEVLGGPEAAEGALYAARLGHEDLRDRVFAFVEVQHDPALVKPLVELLEDKDFRRDADLRRRVARALSIMADPSAVLPLTDLIRSDEDAHVVAAAADSLATYGSAPLDERKEAVRRLVDLYSTTYNLMLSIREEDRVIAGVMKERYKVYAASLRGALQGLTGQQLTRPHEWRDWWNAHKKRKDW